MFVSSGDEDAAAATWFGNSASNGIAVNGWAPRPITWLSAAPISATHSCGDQQHVLELHQHGDLWFGAIVYSGNSVERFMRQPIVRICLSPGRAYLRLIRLLQYLDSAAHLIVGGSGGPSGCATGTPSVRGLSAAPVRDGRNRHGKAASLAIPPTACAIFRTCRCSPRTACGTTVTLSATAIGQRERTRLRRAAEQLERRRWHLVLVADLCRHSGAGESIYRVGAGQPQLRSLQARRCRVWHERQQRLAIRVTATPSAASCIFYDVTMGDNDADCFSGTPNCYLHRARWACCRPRPRRMRRPIRHNPVGTLPPASAR